MKKVNLLLLIPLFLLLLSSCEAYRSNAQVVRQFDYYIVRPDLPRPTTRDQIHRTSGGRVFTRAR